MLNWQSGCVERDAGSAPALGDRVAYVITKGGPSAKNYEKSEDPIYVLEHNLPIDTKYYLENQLSKPLSRIFEPILGAKKVQQLLAGLRHADNYSCCPNLEQLMDFAVKTETLQRVQAAIQEGEYAKGALCMDCMPRAHEFYEKTLTQLNTLESKFSRLWTECQRCQGSLHQDVICSSNDCPIFYMRKKAQKDVQTTAGELKKFDAMSW